MYWTFYYIVYRGFQPTVNVCNLTDNKRHKFIMAMIQQLSHRRVNAIQEPYWIFGVNIDDLLYYHSVIEKEISDDFGVL